MKIIAEIGQNHNGDMDLALELIKAAKRGGADVAKFQVYSAKDLFTKKDNPWYEYNCKTELSFDNLKTLKDLCNKQNIEFMASVFDIERISWLEQLEVSSYKIASRSIYDDILINNVIKTKKPVLISLGMWKKKDLPTYKGDVKYLYCISKYPTPLKEINFTDIDFNQYYGFSDHTIGNTASMIALSRGAQIIEKHFTLDKNMYGPAHSCSMTEDELKGLSGFRNDLSECLK